MGTQPVQAPALAPTPALPPLPFATEEMIRAGLLGGLEPIARRRRGAIWGREFEVPAEWRATWRLPAGYRVPKELPAGIGVFTSRILRERPLLVGRREAGRFVMPELEREVARRMAGIMAHQLRGYPVEALEKYHRDILGLM